jgi:nucleoside-diphosphate-sugar epimerase
MLKDRATFLLTGASGFLGSIILQKLKKENYEVELLGRNKECKYNFDLLDSNLTINENLYTVIHCAGKAHSVPKSPAEIKAFMDVNFEGTKNLCEALTRNNHIPHSFIFISTVAVYGVDEGSMINEDHPLEGITPYATSKIWAEKFLIDWAKQNNVLLSIVRLPLVAGPNPPGNLGAMIKGIKTGKYFSIGKAGAKKSVVWAEDVAHIIPLLAKTGGTYNLTDGYNPSFKELETSIAATLHKKTPVAIPMFFASLLGKVGNLLGKNFPVNTSKINKITATLTFDDARAQQKLNWKPSKVLDKLGEII